MPTHRDHGSALLTIEVEHLDDVDGEGPGPRIQFADQASNMDMTEAGLDRPKRLLLGLPELRIDQLESPEEAERTNVRITARSDTNHLTGFADRVFRAAYDRDEGYRTWVTAV